MPDSDPYFDARRRMIEEQFCSHSPPVSNARVIEAMGRVPRHEFVPAESRNEAYGDYPIPIGYSQTISQPYIVALMTELLDPKPDERILEIGTGSAYQAAVLAEMAGEVYSIEIVPELGQRASEVLSRLGYENIHLKVDDGYRGWPEEAPFDAIIVTCAPDHVPPPLVEQLKESGKMLIPVGGEYEVQELFLLEKRGNSLEKQEIIRVRFVPMTGESQK